MELIELQEQKIIDDFIKSASRENEFLQSFLWGELEKKQGREVRRLGVKEAGKLLALVTLIKKPIVTHFFYWYAPRGPLFLQPNRELENFLFLAIKKLDQRALFIRLEPLAIDRNIKFPIKKTINLQPQQTLLADLKKSPLKLLAEMHQKTRYNIRLAEKKGVQIREGGLEDFSEFWRLINLTGQRDAFRIHSQEHYRNLLTAGQGVIKLFLASYQQKTIAVALTAHWANKVTYLHGASDDHFRNVMAPHLLQWTIIQTAQKAGFSYYDFYGIDQKKWPGVTRFKLGFGGKIREYPGTFDVVFSQFYYKIYQILRVIRRLSF